MGIFESTPTPPCRPNINIWDSLQLIKQLREMQKESQPLTREDQALLYLLVREAIHSFNSCTDYPEKFYISMELDRLYDFVVDHHISPSVLTETYLSITHPNDQV